MISIYQCSLSNNNIHSAFPTHIQTKNHSYTNIKNNLEILHYLPKSRKLNTAEQYEIYKHYTIQPNNILNDQLHFKSHALFDTIIHKTYNTSESRANPLPPPHNLQTRKTVTNSGHSVSYLAEEGEHHAETSYEENKRSKFHM